MIVGGGLRLFKLFGINVYAHWSFGVLLALVAWRHATSAAPGAEAKQAAAGVGFMLAVFACVVMHEFGHALAARQYGIKTRDIIIQIIGGVARLEGSPRTPTQELVIAIAGPMVNVVIAALLLPVVLAIGGYEMMKNVQFAGSSFLSNLLLTNIMLVVFNMIPAFPMDGGRVLRALIWYGAGFELATTIAARVGQVMAIGFIGFAIFARQPMLALVGVFVFLAAGAELHMARMRKKARDELASLGVFSAGDAMLTSVVVLDVRAPVEAAFAAAQQTGQMDFPVVDEGAKTVGVIHRGQLQRAGKLAASAVIGDLAQALPIATTRADRLNVVAERMNQWQTPAIPIVEDGQVVGLVTVESINRTAARGAAPKGSEGALA
jgi:Zn-dependent protease/predicted transcriptional regulator